MKKLSMQKIREQANKNTGNSQQKLDNPHLDQNKSWIEIHKNLKEL